VQQTSADDRGDKQAFTLSYRHIARVGKGQIKESVEHACEDFQSVMFSASGWNGFNVSLRQLRHPRFLQSLRDVLQKTGLRPSLVQLETSESILWDPKLSLGLLQEMKESACGFPSTTSAPNWPPCRLSTASRSTWSNPASVW
jgi:hypothetical protein